MKGMPRAMSVEQFVVNNHGTCPVCRYGFIRLCVSREGNEFFGCSNYPECTFIEDDDYADRDIDDDGPFANWDGSDGWGMR